MVAQELKEKEREEQRRIREQIREEERAQKESEKAVRDAAKEAVIPERQPPGAVELPERPMTCQPCQACGRQLP